jgi:hypothetical protein
MDLTDPDPLWQYAHLPTYKACAEREGLDELDLGGEDAAVDFPLLLLLAQAVAEARQQAAGTRRPKAGHHARQGGAGGQDCRVQGGRDHQRRPAARRPGGTKPQAAADECCHFHFMKYGL